MSDYFNRNPFAAKPETPAPQAPQAPKPSYTDYTQQAMNPVPQGGTDYAALAKDLADQMGEQRQANLEAFSYMTPVTDTEYGIIRNRLLQVKDQGGDFQGEAFKLATAVEMSRYFGRSMPDTIDSFDATYAAWTGREFRPDTTHFRAIADSIKLGSLNIDMGKVARAWMDGGGQDEALEKQLDALSQQIEKYKDYAPRPWIIEALKAGAESAPFTLRAMGAGALAAGGVALALGTTGLAAPATLGILKAGASMLGSFSESADTMRGLEYYDMRKAGIDHETAQASANLSGSLQGAVESLLGNIPGIAGAGIAAKVASRLAIKGGFSAVARAAAGYIGEAIEEGLEEGIQQIISDTIQNEAKEQFGIDIKDADQIAKDAWESAKGGFTASLVIGLPSSIVGGIKTGKTAKALKEYAKTTDRETFIENAGKWDDLEALSDEEKKTTLSKVWEQAQKKAKEQREKAGEGERKPFVRTEAGTLYTEETTVGSAEEGKVEAILKVGDAESKERLGYLKYEVTDDAIIITNAPFKKGYEHLREEAVLELAAKYPDLDIKIAEGAPDSTRSAVESLEGANPRGTGANWYKDQDPDTARARARLRLVISEKMPKVSPVQREAAIMLHEFRANAQGVGFAEYLKKEFSPEIIGTDTSKVSVAQGQRAGILFTKNGQELNIGEFVRDAQALVMVTEKSDFVSFVHESGHLFRKQLIDTDLGKKLDEAYEIVGGQWTRDHEERFVDDLVKYLSYGEAKDERLKSVFQKIAEWITRLWQKVLGQADVDPRVRAVMDELFKSEKSPLSEAARTEAIAEEAEASERGKAVQLEGKDEVLFQDITPEEAEEAKRQLEEVRAKYENTDQWMKAPNGEATNLNERQWLQVRTPAFKAWFGDWENDPENASKVVDENGEPKVVYHGTDNNEFEIFSLKKLGENTFDNASDEWFGATAAVGFWFNESSMIRPPYEKQFECFLNIRHPQEESLDGLADNIANNFDPDLYDTEEEIDEEGNIIVNQWYEGKRYRQKIKTRGQDGLCVDDSEFGGTSWVAFSSAQIKSATGNIGTFKGDDPRILFQPAPPEDSEAFKKWFGDSKVVDAEGKPLVVYHGGSEKIESYARGPKRGTLGVAYFSGTKSTAQKYAYLGGIDNRLGESGEDYIEEYEFVLKYGAEQQKNLLQSRTPEITEVYLSIQNPLNIERVTFDDIIKALGEDYVSSIVENDTERKEGEKVIDYLEREYGNYGPEEWANLIANDLDSFYNADDNYIVPSNAFMFLVLAGELGEYSQTTGHDGIIYFDHETKDTTYVIFDPAQAKSVNNRGTWDTDDPRILFQTSAPTEKAQKVFNAVIDYQGATDDINEAGFVLPDGRMVDLSGRVEDSDYKKAGDRLKINGVDYLKGKRLQAHSDVRWEGSPQGARGYLVRQGAVRIDAKFGIIELDNEPTYEQITILRQLYDGKEIAIEAHDKGREADIRTDDPKRAMGLLRRFYNGENVGSTLFQIEPTEEEQKAFDSALDTMGQTFDVSEAGYVLPSGELLDMSGRFEADYTKSGRKWKPNRGKDFLKGQRSVDHRDIVYDGQPSDRYETMEQFIGYGAIRIDSNASLADMSRLPTPKQWEIIKGIIESNGAAWLEMRDGKRTATITIEGKPSKALGVIRRFYAGEDVSDSSVLFQAEDYDYRRRLTKVRGGWTKAKIIKEVKVHHAKLLSTYGITREIAKFDSPEELEANIYYHGTPDYISGALKPSITMSDRFIEANGGGGYGQKYWGVSLTKNKKVAESFSGAKSSVNIYPVILKKNAIVKEMPDIKDSADLDDHIEKLWNEGVDAVWIGGGEEELVVLNPVAMAPYREHDSYAVFGGFKSKPLTQKQIVDIYKTGVETYKSITAEMQGKTSAERNAISSGIPRILFQLDEDAIDAEAATFDSWQEWKEYVEGYAIPAFGEDTRAPEGVQGEVADGWYAARWEAAHSKAEKEKAKAREKERKEARRGEFASRMAQAGGVEKLLASIWDAQVQAYDTTQAIDEQEQQEIEQAYEWKKDLEQRLADHPLVLLTAQSVGNGKKLKASTRKAILTYIRHNEIEFAALYAELTGDLDLAQYAEAGRKRLHEIPDPKLERYADMSIAERTALLNRITDQDVKAKLKDGTIDDPDLLDYIRRLEESKKSLEKQAKENAEEIEKLGIKADDESYFALKMHEKATGIKKELETRDKELSKLKEQKVKVETAKQAYTDALKSAKEESALTVKIAKKVYAEALQSAQKEARLQTRLVAAEIRATEKLRQQRDGLRRAILKKPSKNIIWEKRQGILTIQEYLRSKKWEYIEEIEEGGKRRRRRAYDTVLGPDGKTHKVPRYTTVQIENLGAALSLLLRESPHLGKLLTNDIVDRINDKPVSAWTVAELTELKKILDTMAKEGRMAYSAKIAQEEYERTEGRNEVNATVRKSKFFKAPFGHGSVEQKELLKNMDKRRVLDLPFLNMRRFASVYMDGGSDGANTRLLVDEEREHYGAKVYQIDRRLGKVFARMQELELGEKDFQEKVTIEGVGPGNTDYTVSIGDLMAIRLALRDRDAKAAFLYGNLFSEEERRTWNAETLQAQGLAKLQKVSRAVDELAPALQEIADLIGEDFDKEFDRLNKAVIELTNQEMKKVAHYFPIHREGAYFDKFGDSILEELKSKYGMINLPDSGFTLERIKIGAAHQTPIKLDLFGTWQKAVERQEHLVSYGSYLKKLNAVYKSRKAGSVREAIIQSFGKAGMDYVDQYISEIANPHEFKGPEEGDRAVRFLRGNMAVGFLAYRWTSVMKQIITSPLPYMAYAPKGMSAAAFQCLKSGNPMQWLSEIEGMSEMLKHRTADQIFETIRNMDREGFEGVVKKIGSVGMKGLEMADRFSVAIGWKGVYDEAIAKGLSEEEAVRKADDITAKTQPSARGVDLAPVFRGNNEWKRLLLQFGSALNVIYQNIRYDMPQAWREREYGRAIAIGVSYSIAGVLLGAFSKAIGRDKSDDDEAWYRDWIYYSMTQFTDSVPIIGNELTGFMKRWIANDKRRYGESDLLPAFQDLLSGVDNLLEGDILKALEEIGTGLGLGIGLPTLAIKEYIEFLINLLGGED